LVACEGEPGSDYTIDPHGSVAIIDVTGGVAGVGQGDVTIVEIGSYTGSWNGVRIFGPSSLPVWADDFQMEDTINYDTIFTHWQEFNVQGSSRQWHEYEYPTGSGTIFARMSGYDAGCQNNEDYLVSETFDLSTYDAASLSFSSAYNFSGPGLELLVSTDFDGTDILGATWDTLTDMAAWPATANYAWQNSGEVDLSDYLDTYVTFAVLYSSDASGCSTWEVDSFMVTGMHSDASNFEPEYIAISDDNATAYVTLQENNAIAVIDLTNSTITNVLPLGWKDHSAEGNGLDASDKDDAINIATYPFRGLYLPDAIAQVSIGGTQYLLTANEGDARDYDAYGEEERVKDLDLDPTAFPDAATLQADENGGRINVTTSMGDTDDDGDFDELYTFGGRSFTIWDDAGNIVFDSGDEFEQMLSTEFPDDFNSDNEENDSFDNRSDNKGPEPEAVEVATINGSHYAFIGLERIGGVFMYDITDPANATYVAYVNNRDFSVSDVTTDAVGDLGVEDVLYIADTISPDGKFYIVTSNEVSGTVSAFEITGIVGVNDIQTENGWKLYPNPASNVLQLSVKGNYKVRDLTGRTILTLKNENRVDVASFTPGLYFISDAEGKTKTFVKN